MWFTCRFDQRCNDGNSVKLRQGSEYRQSAAPKGLWAHSYLVAFDIQWSTMSSHHFPRGKAADPAKMPPSMLSSAPVM